MATRFPQIARLHVPAGVEIVRTERMSRAFTKYHLTDGRVLHRFRLEEPHANPHDHPWAFETEIIAGGYVDEVFHVEPDGSWRSEFVERLPGTVHHIAATHIHRIVRLLSGDCWTIIRAGRHERQTRFWRFGDVVQSRAWNERKWVKHG